jgi:hypothetical protein
MQQVWTLNICWTKHSWLVWTHPKDERELHLQTYFWNTSLQATTPSPPLWGGGGGLSYIQVDGWFPSNMEQAKTPNPWHSRNNQQYALICTTPLFYVLAPTCFGSSLPSSGGFLDPSWVMWNTKWMGGTISYSVWLCGLCARVSWNHDNLAHRSRNHILYDIPPI